MGVRRLRNRVEMAKRLAESFAAEHRGLQDALTGEEFRYRDPKLQAYYERGRADARIILAVPDRAED